MTARRLAAPPKADSSNGGTAAGSRAQDGKLPVASGYGFEGDLRPESAELSRLRAEFAAFSHAISHDLRAPLRSAQGFSRVLLEDHAEDLDEEARDYLRRVSDATLRMGHLIDGLLVWSRLARRAFEPLPLDLSDLASAVAAKVFDRHEDQVGVSVAPGLECTGDCFLLKTLFEQAFANSWQNRRAGTRLEVQVRAARRADDGETVVWIRDNGRGFGSHLPQPPFRPFFASGSGNPDRRGVGLAIVGLVARRHGGRAWAEAEEDGGARLYFSIQGVPQ